MKKATGLGRGLSALIDEAVRPTKGEAASSGGGVRGIEIGRIRPNPLQPRQHFDEQAIDELAASIAERGVLQPILVRETGDGYELIAGERRWRAAQMLSLGEVPAFPVPQAHYPPVVQPTTLGLHEFQRFGVVLADFNFDLLTQ